MASYSSTQSGNWNDSATWGGSGIPGVGDTATINGGHVVTIPSGYEAGIGTDTGTAVTINANGTLLVNGTLFARGNIVVLATSTLSGHLKIDGGILKMLSGFSVTTTTNNLKKVTILDGVAEVVDTSGQRITAPNSSSIGNNYYNWCFEFRNSKFYSFGNGATVSAINTNALQTANCYFIMKNNLFKVNGNIIIRSPDLAGTVFICENNDFRVMSNAYRVTIGGAVADGVTRYIDDCTFYAMSDILVQIPCVWRRCVVLNALVSTTVQPPVSIQECGFWVFNSGGGVSLKRLSISRCIFWFHDPNPHHIGTGTQSYISTVSDCVFDGDGYYSLDTGDTVLVGAGVSGARSRVNIEGSVVINSAGTLATLLNNYSEAVIDHCTAYGRDFNGVIRETHVSVGESAGTDQHVTIKNSIFYRTPYGAYPYSAYVANSLEYCDYTAWGSLTGTRVPNSPLAYVNGRPWRTEYPTDSDYGDVEGWGLNDKRDIDPQFKDSSRRVASYLAVNQEQGMVEGSNTMSENPGWVVGLRMLRRNGYDENGEPAQWDNRYTPVQVLDWIRDGFRPQNVVLQGAASDGTDIGAMPVEIPVYPQGWNNRVWMVI